MTCTSYVCIYICIYICMYIYICIYIYMYTIISYSMYILYIYCIYIYYMGIVWLRALCSVWELVIEFIEVVHVCKKLCTFHRSCARFTRPPNNVRVQLLWNGRLSLGALNQTIPIWLCIYIYMYIYMYIYIYIIMCIYMYIYIVFKTENRNSWHDCWLQVLKKTLQVIPAPPSFPV